MNVFGSDDINASEKKVHCLNYSLYKNIHSEPWEIS